MWLTRVSINNPVFATMMMAALMVLGLFSYRDLAVEEFPNVELPFVVITTAYPGASPEVIESDITRKLEDAVNTVAGVKRVFSTSFEGVSFVIVEFRLEVDSATAIQDVRDKVAVARAEFRDEIDEPVVQRWDPAAQPVLTVAFTSDTLSARELTTYLDQRLTRRLQVIPGVGKVELVGGTKREVRIVPRPEDLQARGIGIEQLVQALRSDNQDLPAGTLVLGNTEQVVQVRARLARPADFARIVVANRNGRPVYVGDIADVLDGAEERQSLALVNGRRAVALEVIKVSGANTVEVAERARATLEALRGELPRGMQMNVIADTSVTIRASLADVLRTLLEGAILAVLIVFLFLGSWRSTVITGLTLPISLLGTVFCLWVFGFTINMMTLMAMSLCIGILIDDAIVVRENIVRHGSMGKDARTAALDGTREIGLAVLATTLSIVAVFLPVAFMGGIIGKFFFQFGVAVSCAVLLSMFVSFTLDPMLSSVWHDPHVHGHRGGGRLSRLLDGFQEGLNRLGERYSRLIRWSLQSHRHRLAVLALAVASLPLAGLIAAVGVESEFVPEPDLSEISIKIRTPVGASLEYTEQKALQVDNIVRRHAEVIDTYISINGAGGFGAGKNDARFRVKLKPKGQRQLSQQQLVSLLRSELQQVGGIDVDSVAAAKEAVTGGMKPIMISVQGADLAELQRLSDELTAQLGRIPGLADIESSLKAPRPLLAVEVNREAASDLGLSVAAIGGALRPFLGGDAISSWQGPDGENYDVTVQLPREAREARDVLQDLWFAGSDPGTGRPQMVALSQVVTVEDSIGAAQINRRNQFREVMIQANVEGRATGSVQADIDKVMNSYPFPAGYRFEYEGQAKDMAESVYYASIALSLAVIFIYMVLASQFNSFVHPVAIMTSLPLSLVGVFLALAIFRSTLNIFSIIGVVMLMGLVTKNAILLVDFIKEAMLRGMERTEAIVTAGRTRLRPILMTTAAMVMGMVPLALGLGEGGEQRAPMAHAIIGGLITSTLLTLVVVPVVFTYLDDLTQVLKRVLGIGKQPT